MKEFLKPIHQHPAFLLISFSQVVCQEWDKEKLKILAGYRALLPACPRCYKKKLMNKKQFSITKELAGLRLDQALARFLDSRTQALRFIQSGLVQMESTAKAKTLSSSRAWRHHHCHKEGICRGKRRSL